ncbi:hypothetical protein [Methylobacterium sp. E-066]|uniref:hypothetical protein n=1 Tax=Methylobacterium sp. E-066 TaxID=2836584 RepID=UPI001FB87219|nr:hypothetical protein [Methylobacterium sp. E-066]MCJ2143575.1 hypothetical protein [Methylobacterium sp. E-066]
MTRLKLLHADLFQALTAVGTKLRDGGDASFELKLALDLLGSLEPSHVARLDGEIANVAGLYRHPPQPLWGRLLSPRPNQSEQLLRMPGLEYLFIFHRDGRLREAALLKITGGLPSPFLFAAVVWRLNDWVAPVREAAIRCANRSFTVTSPSIVARAAAELLVRQASWGRWRGERAVLDRVFSRADVAAQLAELIACQRTGPQASTLREALRTPALDQHLEKIAYEAIQPSVRALALKVLIDRKAEWPSGTVWQWIDKSMGLRRQVAAFDHRIINLALSRTALIAHGVNDRSAVVRREALTGVIRYLPGTTEARAFAAPLLADRSPSVRERAEFILRPSAIGPGSGT